MWTPKNLGMIGFCLVYLAFVVGVSFFLCMTARTIRSGPGSWAAKVWLYFSATILCYWSMVALLFASILPVLGKYLLPDLLIYGLGGLALFLVMLINSSHSKYSGKYYTCIFSTEHLVGDSAIVCLLSFLVCSAINVPDIYAINLSQSELESWCLNGAFFAKDNSNKTDNSRRVSAMLSEQNRLAPLAKAVYLVSSSCNESQKEISKQLLLHAASLPAESREKKLWEGIGELYQGDRSRAFKLLCEVDEYDLALAALYYGEIKIDSFENKGDLKMPESMVNPLLAAVIQESSVEINDLPITAAEKAILDRLSKIENSIQGDRKAKLDTAALGNWVFTRTLALAQPSFPAVNLDYNFFLFAMYAFPLLWIIWLTFWLERWLLNFHLTKRSKWQAVVECFKHSAKKLESCVPRSPLVSKIALWILRAESELNSPGIFSGELGAIDKARFPRDFLLAIMTVRRVRAMKNKHHENDAARENVKYILNSIKQLGGKLAPKGNEESLALIYGINGRATEIWQSYIKQEVDWQWARDNLLELLSNLAMVGDILEARNSKVTPAYYLVLGINRSSSQADVKKAYRSVMGVIHPDRTQGCGYLDELARTVNEAYSVLSNETRRKAYDLASSF